MKYIQDVNEQTIINYIVLNAGVVRCDIETQTPNVCFLSNLTVDKESRNNGIGTKLIQEAEKYARYMNCNTISLLVLHNSWMKDWYVRLGYVPNIMWDNEHVLMNKNITQ